MGDYGTTYIVLRCTHCKRLEALQEAHPGLRHLDTRRCFGCGAEGTMARFGRSDASDGADGGKAE